MIKRRFLLAMIGTLLCVPMLSAQEGGSYKIVVNVSNSMQTISQVTLSQIFLKKVTTWNDGAEIFPVDLVEESLIRKVFSLKIHKRSIAKIKSYWKRQVFAKKNYPPPQMEDEQDVIAFVASDASAIGYVSRSTPVNGAGVKVILIEN